MKLGFSITVFTEIILLLITHCTGQNIIVTKPVLSLANDTLLIEYDILNSKSSDEFIITLELTDSAGNILVPADVKGDLGQNISGGENKKIICSIENLLLYADIDIYVEIKAERISKKSKDITSSYISRRYKTAGLLVRSSLLPGWGLSKMKNGKSFYIMGILGYGCIAGSIYLNNKSYDNYNSYLYIVNSGLMTDEGLDFYDKAELQDKLSKSLAYSAISIWAINMLWTALKIGPYKRESNKLSSYNYSFYISSNQHLESTIGFRLNF